MYIFIMNLCSLTLNDGEDFVFSDYNSVHMFKIEDGLNVHMTKIEDGMNVVEQKHILTILS